MTGFKLNIFSGLRPRIPESLLENNEATIAHNCDFAYGELRNTKGGFDFLYLSNTPLSIYTENGLTFYSWPGDVDVIRSSMVNDIYNRLYYSTDGIIRTATRDGAGANGGIPSTSYRVGVPRPTVKPVLETAFSTPDVSKVNIEYRFHYESVGVKYQEQAISTVKLSEDSWSFTPPNKDSSTPANTFPVLRITVRWKDNNELVFDSYSTNSSFRSIGYYVLDITKDPGGTSVKTYTAKITLKINEADKEARAYVYTYVNIMGEEGPPSDYAITTLIPTNDVKVTVTKDNISDYAPIKEIRVYRTPSGATSTDYYYIGSVNVLNGSGSFVFNDNVDGALLNELLSSTGYYPPAQGLYGLSILPNGIMMAAKGNELHFSEPYKPWAWPPEYAKPLPYAVKGGITIGSGAVITTSAHPYFVSGVSPDSMTVSKINVDQAGVSKWSIAVVDGVVMYASNDGIVTISGATGSLEASQHFFTREVWRQKYGAGLSTMRFAVWDGRLVVYSQTGAFVPFMIRFDEAQGSLTDLPDFVAQCSFVSPLSDQLYYAVGPKLCQFAGGSQQNAVWQSAEIVFPKPVNFGAGQSVVEGTWTMELYAYEKNPLSGIYEYNLKHSGTVLTGTTDFRLPSGYESDRYRIKIFGNGRFRELRIAQSFRELSTL